MEKGNGMVARLDMAGADHSVAFGLDGRLEHHLLEEVFIDEIGAGTGQKVRAAGHQFHRPAVDRFVAAAGLVDVLPLLGKGRRVKDDEIVRLSRLQIFEDIGFNDVVLFEWNVVEQGVLFRIAASALAAVDARARTPLPL